MLNEMFATADVNVHCFAVCPNGHRCVIADESSNAARAVQCAACGEGFIALGPFDRASFSGRL
jgi:hypothetical protein